MTKYLITGFSGFVSRHFLNLLESESVQVSVLGLDINQPDFDYKAYKYVQCQFKVLDLLQKEELDNTLYQYQPNFILHLASFSSVAFSWKSPGLSFANNTNIFLNLLEHVRKMDIKCRILSVGSSEEYGNVSTDKLPLHEDMELFPVSPYAVARVSQEMLSKVYVQGYGMDIVMTRSFNHIGPWQKEIFVVPSFAKQLCEMKNKGEACVLRTGNLNIIRDFVDVRDVVRAYLMLMRKGSNGEIYNICSGEGTSLKDIINIMGSILQVDVKCVTDPDLVRPSDNQVIVGSKNKISDHIGWSPSISMKQSLEDIIRYWETKN